MFRESLKLVKNEKEEKNELAALMERREVLFHELLQLPAVKEASLLLDKLPKLVYHTKEHTFGEDGVIAETILFGLADNISRGALEQQVIAAAWHDVGYLEQYTNNEPVAIKLFTESEAYKQLGPDIRDEIAANIADTAMVFKDTGPHLHMSHSTLGYMMDADVSNFGRTDFEECKKKIALETGVDLSDPAQEEKMDRFVINLLENHTWHTEGARKLREEQKQKNLTSLRSKYPDLKSGYEIKERKAA
ncbi:MAG: hypothetical protein K9M10_02055 [Candidatus Pacebacteria bacterium]|nr:hypothetical protein [Candidatus Paceibacterota bacterium]MCF7857247.1 hypothetical protein [Candidatus Paceibacterota bacterium]